MEIEVNYILIPLEIKCQPFEELSDYKVFLQLQIWDSVKVT